MLEIHLDMDGTIADLYHNDDWMIDINTGRTEAYEEAPLMHPLDDLLHQLVMAKAHDAKIVINTWLPEGASDEYMDRVAWAKLVWLAEKRILPYIDRFHALPYGTPKSSVVQSDDAALFDDSPACRREFEEAGFSSIDPWPVD